MGFARRGCRCKRRQASDKSVVADRIGIKHSVVLPKAGGDKPVGDTEMGY